MFVLGIENGNPSPLEERGLQWWIRSYDFPRQFNNWSVVSTVDMLYKICSAHQWMALDQHVFRYTDPVFHH